MSSYQRSIHYYETDKMGVMHHSNYIRLMEEARIAFMDEIHYSYQRLEGEGIISPVTAIGGKYLASVTFGDAVTVETGIESFNGVVLKITYTMSKADGTKVFTGSSEHMFLDGEGRIVRLKRTHPEFYALLMSLVPAAQGAAEEK